MLDGGGEEVSGGEDFEVALGFPVVAGTVDDGGGLFVPCDFLEREGGAQEVFGELAPAIDVVCGDKSFCPSPHLRNPHARHAANHH